MLQVAHKQDQLDASYKYPYQHMRNESNNTFHKLINGYTIIHVKKSYSHTIIHHKYANQTNNHKIYFY